MIAQQAQFARHHLVDALARIRAISNDIAQTIDLGNPQPANVGEYRLQRFQVGVDIANDRAQRRFLNANGNAGDGHKSNRGDGFSKSA